MYYKKGSLLTEGKTKRIWEIVNSTSLVLIENKNNITAFDNPLFTRQFNTKATDFRIIH